MQHKDINISDLVGCRVVRDFPQTEVRRMPLLTGLYTGIEVEGEEAVLNDTFSVREAGWNLTSDGSLRAGGVEFVLASPLNGNRLAASVEALFRSRRVGDVGWEDSPRAGTHIHLNVSDKKLGFVQALTSLVYCTDELIFRLAGEDRRWCSFCNSLNTLPAGALRALLKDGDSPEDLMRWHHFWPLDAGNRYYGLNISSVAKFGTMEFRYFPSPTEEEQLWKWLDLCHRLYEVAERFEDEESPSGAVLEMAKENTVELLELVEFSGTAEEDAASVVEAAEELHEVLSFEDYREQETEPVSLTEWLSQTRRQADDVAELFHSSYNSVNITNRITNLGE